MYITMSKCVLVQLVRLTVCILSASMFTVWLTRLVSLAETVLNYLQSTPKTKTTFDYDCMYIGFNFGTYVILSRRNVGLVILLYEKY